MNQDQLKQHVNKRLEGSNYSLESEGDKLAFVSGKGREVLILGSDDAKNEINANKFCDRLIGKAKAAPVDETEDEEDDIDPDDVGEGDGDSDNEKENEK